MKGGGTLRQRRGAESVGPGRGYLGAACGGQPDLEDLLDRSLERLEVGPRAFVGAKGATVDLRKLGSGCSLN